MGLTSFASSSFSHAAITPNPHKFDTKLQSFNQIKTTHFVNFKIYSTKFHGFSFKIPRCCKTTEMIQFDERTSANEGKVVRVWMYATTHQLTLCAKKKRLFANDPRWKFCRTTFVIKRSAISLVRLEIERCYKLIHRLGRGVIYIGSARPGPDHPHYMQALNLSREIANLLDCTSWTGAGPGLMDAATRGAMEAGKTVGGFKIEKEAGQWSSTGSHPYLPHDTYLTCRFFSARKHGLVDAAVRNSPSDRTAVIALPGGIGTLDEMFEMLALIQLQRIGSQLPVPFLVMNYDAYYSKLLEFLQDCEHWGTIAKGEVDPLWKVCKTNEEALAHLARFYNLPVRS